MRKGLGLSVVLFVFAISGCTNPGETTKIGTAAGAGIGAGLGAIVGSATGDAATGLVIGAAAGGGTGALVGNALESQQEAIKSQDEALERQEQMIRAQANEIRELRRLSQDGVSYETVDTISVPEDDRIRNLKLQAIRKGRVKGNPILVPEAQLTAREGASREVSIEHSAPTRMSYNAQPASPRYRLSDSTLVDKGPRRAAELGANELSSQNRYESFSNPKQVQEQAQKRVEATKPRLMQEATTQKETSPVLEEIYARPEEDSESQSDDNSFVKRDAGSTENTGAHLGQVETTPECQKAEQEIRRANVADDAADKLFHFRRALRYCPHNAAYHNGLGEVYLSLGRHEDARFEFEEALGVDSTFMAAKRNLQKLES